MSDPKKLQWPEAFLFDLDGTLFQTETLLVSVHDRVFATLKEEGLYTLPKPPVERLLGCLGMLLEDIWNIVMPESSHAARQRADELMLQYELEGLDAGIGELYPNVASTLMTLKERGCRLFIASNGLELYVKGVPQAKGIHHLFDQMYSAGEFSTRSKVDLVKQLLEDHQISSAWMVGDRSSDVEAGKKNGLIVVGCNYAGFGSNELNESDIIIHHFEEILTYLK